MRQTILFLFTALVFCLAAPAEAMHHDSFMRFCPDEFQKFDIPVPVGCEAVDCCPGCPGPLDVLEWRILVDKELGRPIQIAFDGMDENAMRRLQVRGNAQFEGNTLFVMPGESFVSGLPNARKGQVPVGTVTIQRDADADKDSAAPRGEFGVEIQQLSGKFIVNRFRARYALSVCDTTFAISDNIRVTNNTAGDSTVVLADYRKSGTCRDDVIHRVTTQRSIGNAQANSGCNSEISVFSDDNAMRFQTNVTTWTNVAGDLHSAALGPILVAPITVWVAAPNALARAQNDVANANLLYNRNNVGVRFNTTFNNVSGNANAVNTIGGTAGDCATAGALGTTAFFTPGRINIYYVNGAFTGINCNANRNVSFIGTTANLGSLPHEIGHAYALRPAANGGHTNGLPGFGNNNIMNGGGPATRDHFSVGQAFRINVSDISMLNLNGTRTGTTRTCAPLTVSNLCPTLALDATPH